MKNRSKIETILSLIINVVLCSVCVCVALMQMLVTAATVAGIAVVVLVSSKHSRSRS